MNFDLEKWLIVDIETKGLLDDIKDSSDLHCMSVGWEQDGEFKVKSTNKEEDIKKVFENPNNTIVGHFFLGYDLPALRKMFPNINFQAKVIDSLAVSHYLYNDRLKHGLEDYGVELGFEKIKVEKDEWLTLSYEKAVERCERDCLINYYVWKNELRLLRELYDTDEEIYSPISRVNFKMILLNIQENNKIKLDIELCKKNLLFLEGIIESKVFELKSIMPKIPIKSIRIRPKSMFKKDGSYSVQGANWAQLTKLIGKDENFDQDIETITDWLEPNPSSSQQMKAYLVSKGWTAKLFKDGVNGKVGQLRDDDKNLCKSIVKLIETNPKLESLQGLSVAQHRAGYLKAFLSTMDKDGYIKAGWSGMAKTFRVKHYKPICNLPSNNSEYGDLIRSCLIAPEGKVFVNADLSSLEDKTKQCAIYKYAPDYVETLNTPGYDAHLAIGLKSGFLTEEECEFFKWYKDENRDVNKIPMGFEVYTKEELLEQFKKVSKVRKSSKVVNYACTYSASPKKIAETADISLKEAQTLHKAYWDTNISIRQYTDSLTVKTIDNRNWIYNPFTKLWLLLTADHIKFSACNQNHGACVFDTFLWFLVQVGINPIMTIHDELSFYVDRGQEDWARRIIKESMDKVNIIFNLPIKFESNPEFAKSYGNVH